MAIALARRISAWHASIAITVFNTITPMIVRILTSYESHPEQGSMSSSKYLKVTAFRWFNTAIIIQIITPFADTLREGSDDYLLESVFVLFFFDLFARPVLQLVDIWGTLCRHVFAPRAKDQRVMNVKFAAGELDIGDLYTEVTRYEHRCWSADFYSQVYPNTIHLLKQRTTQTGSFSFSFFTSPYFRLHFGMPLQFSVHVFGWISFPS